MIRFVIEIVFNLSRGIFTLEKNKHQWKSALSTFNQGDSNAKIKQGIPVPWYRLPPVLLGTFDRQA